jgi:hypothetical protein
MKNTDNMHRLYNISYLQGIYNEQVRNGRYCNCEDLRNPHNYEDNYFE